TMALIRTATMQSQTTNTPRRPRRIAAVIAAKSGINIASAIGRDMLEAALQTAWLIAKSSHGQFENYTKRTGYFHDRRFEIAQEVRHNPVNRCARLAVPLGK